MGTLLIAAREEEQGTLRSELGSQHRLHFCSNLAQAAAQLASDIDAVLCSPHFGDGQLFELLEMVRLQAGMRRTPVHAVVVHSRHFSHHFVKGLESAMAVMGGQGVLDYAGWRRELGQVRAGQALRSAVADIADDARCGQGQRSSDWLLMAA